MDAQWSAGRQPASGQPRLKTRRRLHRIASTPARLPLPHPPPTPTHPLTRRRLKAIQDLVPGDVEAALSKLPRDVSPDCVALLRRIFSIAPATRPALADIMADPWCAAGWRCVCRAGAAPWPAAACLP